MTKLNSRRCKSCQLIFQKIRPLQNTCSIDCAISHANKLKKAQEATCKRLERVKTKKAIDSIKTKSEWLKEAQRFFNVYIRTRDEKEKCICCNRSTNMDTGIYGHAWDAGHYRSIGSAPHLRFNENNVHKQLVFCNRYGSGKAVDYRIGLIARIGLQAVEELESDQTPTHYTIEEIKAIKVKYKQLTKQLKEEQ